MIAISSSCEIIPTLNDDGFFGYDLNNDGGTEIIQIENWNELYELIDQNSPAKKGVTYNAEGDTIAWRYGLDSVLVNGIKLDLHGNTSFDGQYEGIINHDIRYDRLTFTELWDCYVLRTFEIGTWTDCGLFEEKDYEQFQRFFVHLDGRIYWWPTSHFQIDWCFTTTSGCQTPCESWVGEVDEVRIFLQ